MEELQQNQMNSSVDGNRMASENSSLINYRLDQQRLSVRVSVEEAMISSYQGSKYILGVFSFVCIGKLTASILILSFCNTKTSEPLDIYIKGCIFIDILNMMVLIAKILMSFSIVPQLFKIATSYLDFFIGLVYIAWFSLGNLWFYSCDDCFDEAPELTILSLVYIVMGCFYLCMPMMLICCLCMCIPIIILLLVVVDTRNQNPATDEMIRRLAVEDYNPNQHIGERSCAICSDEFRNGVKIIALSCDSRHIFHENCIKTWLRVNSICPLCRVPIV
ncbi:unnamed protein product [Blepharisma stoltei]|uniref:RING-type domain-containing protein n=1 Tax=Blepharisma stoltei TaxID=1481888 RepID=A0AAU9KAY6_9CILI|nr:unnamed protein product [Blepharisma stoltei]